MNGTVRIAFDWKVGECTGGQSGRTLDYEFSYGDEITITPRNYAFDFRHTSTCNSHYAIIGMAHIAGNYPLYYDAINEKGLGMAGLNFVGNAVYAEPDDSKENVKKTSCCKKEYIIRHSLYEKSSNYRAI